MKAKMFAALSLLLIAFTVMSAMALAQETTNPQDGQNAALDESGTDAMVNPIGAQVRLLQLEKMITINSLYGQQVIDQSKSNGYSVDTAALQAIVDSLNDVKTKVKALDPAASDAVEQFVQLRQEAMNLTREFRQSVAGNLTIDQRQRIRDSFNVNDDQDVKDLNTQITAKIREYNKDMATTLAKNLGITDQDFLNRISTGNITVKELRQTLIDKYKSLTPDAKKTFQQSVKGLMLGRLNIRQRAFARMFGLDSGNIGKLKDIVNDNSLTYAEKTAKLRVFVRDNLRGRFQGNGRMMNGTRPPMGGRGGSQ